MYKILPKNVISCIQDNSDKFAVKLAQKMIGDHIALIAVNSIESELIDSSYVKNDAVVQSLSDNFINNLIPELASNGSTKSFYKIMCGDDSIHPANTRESLALMYLKNAKSEARSRYEDLYTKFENGDIEIKDGFPGVIAASFENLEFSNTLISEMVNRDRKNFSFEEDDIINAVKKSVNESIEETGEKLEIIKLAEQEIADVKKIAKEKLDNATTKQPPETSLGSDDGSGGGDDSGEPEPDDPDTNDNNTTPEGGAESYLGVVKRKFPITPLKFETDYGDNKLSKESIKTYILENSLEEYRSFIDNRTLILKDRLDADDQNIMRAFEDYRENCLEAYDEIKTVQDIFTHDIGIGPYGIINKTAQTYVIGSSLRSYESSNFSVEIIDKIIARDDIVIKDKVTAAALSVESLILNDYLEREKDFDYRDKIKRSIESRNESINDFLTMNNDEEISSILMGVEKLGKYKNVSSYIKHDRIEQDLKSLESSLGLNEIVDVDKLIDESIDRIHTMTGGVYSKESLEVIREIIVDNTIKDHGNYFHKMINKFSVEQSLESGDLPDEEESTVIRNKAALYTAYLRTLENFSIISELDSQDMMEI